MKTTNLILVLISFLILGSGCKSQVKSDENADVKVISDNVEVYYFHLTTRCITCKAIETEARKFVEELYKGKVHFKVFDYQNEANADLIEKLDVKGQELFIISEKGKIDITNQGFMYARTNPEKLRDIIKENIDPLL